MSSDITLRVARWDDVKPPEWLSKINYDRGILYHDAKSGMAMLEDADQNASQAQRLDKLRKTMKFRNAVEEIMYGGI